MFLTCDAYYGKGNNEGARCIRYEGHPPFSEDKIGHSDMIRDLPPPKITSLRWKEEIQMYSTEVEDFQTTIDYEFPKTTVCHKFPIGSVVVNKHAGKLTILGIVSEDSKAFYETAESGERSVDWVDEHFELVNAPQPQKVSFEIGQRWKSDNSCYIIADGPDRTGNWIAHRHTIGSDNYEMVIVDENAPRVYGWVLREPEPNYPNDIYVGIYEGNYTRVQDGVIAESLEILEQYSLPHNYHIKPDGTWEYIASA